MHVSGTSYSVTGLTNGQSYSFKVAAHNSVGTGPQTSSVSATPLTVPNVPTGITAVAGNGQVALNWTAPSLNGGGAIDYYIVYQDGVDVAHVTSISTTITGLTNGQSYSFKVAAHNSAGNSTQTSSVSATPLTVPDVPTGLTATVGNGNASLSWTAPSSNGGAAIDYYIVYQDGVDVAHVTSISTTITGLTNGQSYSFKVAAHNSAGTGPQTSAVNAIPFKVPTIVAKSPTGSDVSKGATISVLFSQAMNKTATTITVNGVTGTVSWSGNNATFTPSSALAYNTTYSVTVNGKDLTGKALSTTKWNFTTLKDEGIISSTLKDAKGNAIAYATVSLSNGMNTTTDVYGYFEFDNVTSGTYTLTIAKDGYQTVTQTVSTAAGQTTALSPLSMQSNASSNDYTLPIVAGDRSVSWRCSPVYSWCSNGGRSKRKRRTKRGLGPHFIIFHF